MRFEYELRRSTSDGKKKTKSLKSGNEMISSNDRLDPHTKADLTAHLRELSKNVALAIYEHPERVMFSTENPCHVIVRVCPPTDRRMDAPNWYPTVKALIDGLTDAGVFEDDNDRVIRWHLFLRGPRTGNKKYKIILDIEKGADIPWPI